MVARDFLLFRLAGPMAAFGKIAVGERRDIWGEPSKSGVLGFVAGAQGLTRDDTLAHQALEAGLGFAVRIDNPGRPMRDYHTAQTPKARKNLSWRTRKGELSDRDNLNTVLSERLYRLEARATIALWRKVEDGPDLTLLRDAIRRPGFIPYLGRKSCPLGEPPRPQVVSADGLAIAFQAYDALRAPEDRTAGAPVSLGADCPIWLELDAGLDDEDARAQPIRQRRDATRDRVLRQFADRREGRLPQAGQPQDDDLLKEIVT